MTPRRSIPFVLAALAATAQAGAMQQAEDADVAVEVEQFGVGNAYRPGAITAMRLVLTSSLDEPTPVWVQWEVPNAEGDIAEYGRSVVLNPGSRELLWLYAPLSPHTMDDTRWTVRVFEERDGQRRRELGGDSRISPIRSGAARVELDTGMIAVVGRARMRLEDYSTTWNGRPRPPGAHELTRIISGIAPQAMPDRWEGLSAFEAVVWSDALPQQLRVDSATALREYVRRGGHLVIILPEAGNPWGLGSLGETWLDDLLIGQAPRRDDDVMLSELMPILSKTRLPPVRDFQMSLRVFKEIGGRFNAIDNRYEPLVALGDGRVIAVQRLVDFGRITIIGIDLTSQRLASMRLPQADAFWNRILGRRVDTPQPGELLTMDENKPRMLTRGSANEMNIGDGRLLDGINKRGRAARGLMAAVLLFIVYFVIAGPGGFLFLKQQRMSRHSWLVFAATAGVFTAVAWGGVRFLRQSDTEFRHVTFLDHVVRPGTSLGSEPHYQRAVSWGSLYLPKYGTVDVSIEDDPGQSGQNLLFTWEAPPPRQPDRFPNVDRYMIDVGRSPADYTLPVRAAATQLYMNWMGALDPDWGGTLRVDPDDPIRITLGPGNFARFNGTLINDLPGVLRDICVIWVSNHRNRQREYLLDDLDELSWVPPSRSGQLLNTGHMLAGDAGAEPWYPGTTLSLADFVPDGLTDLERNIDKKFIEPEEGDGMNFTGLGGSNWQSHKLHDYMEMLSIYHQLTPPRYIRDDDKDPQAAVITRRLTRELDLSAWFTRPCLIIIGYLDGSETPVPFLVDGKTPRSEGLTVVRWIYPLPLVETQIIPDPGFTPTR